MQGLRRVARSAKRALQSHARVQTRAVQSTRRAEPSFSAGPGKRWEVIPEMTDEFRWDKLDLAKWEPYSKGTRPLARAQSDPCMLRLAFVCI